jgi:hypothetical protein
MKYEICTICGADLWRSSTYAWHYKDEDCRAVHEPVTTTTGHEAYYSTSAQVMREAMGIDHPPMRAIDDDPLLLPFEEIDWDNELRKLGAGELPQAPRW